MSHFFILLGCVALKLYIRHHNVRFLIYSIVLTDVKARIQPVNPTVFVIDPEKSNFNILIRLILVRVIFLFL